MSRAPKRAVKQLIAAGLHWSGARAALAFGRRVSAGGRRVVVVGYHRVCRDFEAERPRCIETCLIGRDTFARHVAFLKRRFEIASMSRAVDVLDCRVPASRDLAVITFDDGYRDVLDNALPILADAGATATVYVSSDVVARAGHFPHDRLFTLLQVWDASQSLIRQALPPDTREVLSAATRSPAGPRAWLHALIRDRTPAEIDQLIDRLGRAAQLPAGPPATASALDWEGVRALAAAGWEVGAHTTGHCVLTHLDRDGIERDVRECKAAIEASVGARVRHFAYCNGYYNAAVIGALRRAGFASGLTTEDRLNRLGDDPFRIARRVLWEGSAAGATGKTSPSLLACQLDDAWCAIGLATSEPGVRPEPRRDIEAEADRRLA